MLRVACFSLQATVSNDTIGTFFISPGQGHNVQPDETFTYRSALRAPSTPGKIVGDDTGAVPFAELRTTFGGVMAKQPGGRNSRHAADHLLPHGRPGRSGRELLFQLRVDVRPQRPGDRPNPVGFVDEPALATYSFSPTGWATFGISPARSCRSGASATSRHATGRCTRSCRTSGTSASTRSAFAIADVQMANSTAIKLKRDAEH